MLTDRTWKLKYTPDDGDLVEVFYIQALHDAARYDRLTGYFDAGALALAARGVEGLVRNDGRMRLVVGCTLAPVEIDAINRGEALRDRVERRLVELPLAPPDAQAADALELLAWMIGCGHLDVKVAVPCDADGRPVNDTAIFHEKSGVIEDRAGYKIAWTGSLNETAIRSFLIRPPTAHFSFTEIHGLRWEDVRDAPTFGRTRVRARGPSARNTASTRRGASTAPTTTHALTTAGAGSAHGAEPCSEK